MRRVLSADGTAVVSQVAAITGLGGIGKTQTALEYAHRYRDNYRVVWWIEADSTAGLDRGIAELAATLQLPGADLTDPARTRAALGRWLESERGWLLILDNADQPETVQPYLPVAPAGHVLITSRNPLWEELGETLALDTWPRERSIEFLTLRAKCEDPVGAAKVAAALGDLPLALEQAAAYVRATPGESLAGYLVVYHAHFAELASEFRPQLYPNTVLTTWDVSLAAAERKNAIAGDLLRLIAFLAPEDIPRALVIDHAPRSLSRSLKLLRTALPSTRP